MSWGSVKKSKRLLHNKRAQAGKTSATPFLRLNSTKMSPDKKGASGCNSNYAFLNSSQPACLTSEHTQRLNAGQKKIPAAA